MALFMEKLCHLEGAHDDACTRRGTFRAPVPQGTAILALLSVEYVVEKIEE